MATQFAMDEGDEFKTSNGADSDSENEDFCYNFSLRCQSDSPAHNNNHDDDDDDQEDDEDDEKGELQDNIIEQNDRSHSPSIPRTSPSLRQPIIVSPNSGPSSLLKQHRQRSGSFTKTLGKDAPVMLTKQRAILTAGRPPWQDAQVGPFVIGICGGSASGKTTVAKKIIEELDVPWVTLLCMDSFYKDLNEEAHRLAENNDYNFDHPDAFDFDLLTSTLARLKLGKPVEVPCYNFVTHSREKRTNTLYGANVIICEGILLFANKKLLDMMDMKIFIDTDSDVRLSRRLRRDITERGRDLEGVLKQYNKFVKPAFDHHIAPSMIHADLIVPRGGENKVAINLVVRHVKEWPKIVNNKLNNN